MSLRASHEGSLPLTGRRSREPAAGSHPRSGSFVIVVSGHPCRVLDGIFEPILFLKYWNEEECRVNDCDGDRPADHFAGVVPRP